MLDFLGQPSFGVGSTRFGPALSGGVSAYFSDMLGDHQLGAAIQAQGSVKDIGGQIFIGELRASLNWAVSAGHIPYLQGQTFVEGDGSGNTIVSQFIERIYVDQLTGFAYRPFSQTRRFETSVGYTGVGLEYAELRQYLLSPSALFFDELREDDNDAPEPLHFVEETSMALVGDNANYGFTSPVVGQRYRIEVAPTFGTLNYQTGLLDYRRYVFMQPFSFAMRAMHYGRYGGGGNSSRLQPLFLGYETFIRGYSVE